VIEKRKRFRAIMVAAYQGSVSAWERCRKRAYSERYLEFQLWDEELLISFRERLW
jgi:hypothetical protein